MEDNDIELPLVRQRGTFSADRCQETCVATVAIKSGDSRVVIAVLRVSVHPEAYRTYD